VTGTHAGIAVRVSAHPAVVALCAAFGGALVSTSANRAGQPAAHAIEQLDPRIVDGGDAVLEGETGGLDRPTEIRDARTGVALRL
jgi:L-threonylcarbamoyladenylate synthase